MLTDERIAEIEARCNAAGGTYHEWRLFAQAARGDVWGLLADLKEVKGNLRIALESVVTDGGWLDTHEEIATHIWWDTLGREVVRWAGDLLVDMGLWERRPGGEGDHQRYRPIGKATEGQHG